MVLSGKKLNNRNFLKGHLPPPTRNSRKTEPLTSNQEVQPERTVNQPLSLLCVDYH